VSTPLDDAAAALPAPDDFFGLALDPAWREVHRYQPTSVDGHEVIVSVARMPAEFWRIQSPDLELDLETGSGIRRRDLADSIARAVADGLLGVSNSPSELGGDGP
jgi:hypothetical protein